MSKLSKRDRLYQRIHSHGLDLIRLFDLPSDTDPISLCKKLKRIETKLHRLNEGYCNGDVDTIEWENVKDRQLDNIDKVLGFRASNIPVFINGDPRGYAIKIDDEYMRSRDISFYRDMGGYGIIAPDFTEE